MSGLPDDALRAAVLKTLADDVTEAVTGGKGDLKGAMEELGVKALTAKLPDGTEVATITRAGGHSVPRITSPAKFLAWVQETHPSETEVIVRPGYAEQLLAAMKKSGRAVDPRTGETVPGVEFGDTTSYLSVSFAKGDIDGREHIRRAWRDGSIDPLAGLRELPAIKDKS